MGKDESQFSDVPDESADSPAASEDEGLVGAVPGVVSARGREFPGRKSGAKEKAAESARNEWEEALFAEVAPEAAVEEEPAEVAPEAEAPAAEAEAEAESEEEDLKELGPRAQKRILQLLGRAKEAEKELVALRTQVEGLHAPEKAAAGEPDGLGPVDARAVIAGIRTSVQERIGQLEQLVDLAEANPEGVELEDGKGGKTFFEAARLRTIAAESRRELRVLAAQDAVERARARELYEANQARFLEVARGEFDFFKDASRPEHQVAQAILRAAPELRRFANWPLAVGILARGLVEFDRKGRGDAAPAGKAVTAAGQGKGVPVSGSPAKDVPARRAPVAPRVGAAVAAGVPRVSGAAGLRKNQAGRKLVEAALSDDVGAQEDALAEILYGHG